MEQVTAQERMMWGLGAEYRRKQAQEAKRAEEAAELAYRARMAAEEAARKAVAAMPRLTVAALRNALRDMPDDAGLQIEALGPEEDFIEHGDDVVSVRVERAVILMARSAFLDRH